MTVFDNETVFDDVFEFTNVTRPIELGKGGQGALIDRRNVSVVSFRELFNEVVRQSGNVFAAFSKGWQKIGITFKR